MMNKLSINQLFESIPLPEQGSNRGYSPAQLIQHFWIGIWCGAACFEHLEITRQDDVIRKLFGWKRIAGSKVFQRYFNKFNQCINQNVYNDLYRWFFNNLKFDNYTLDFASTIMTRYGSLQGAKKGYNPKKPGRNSHHPLMAFVSECRMTANFWLHPGDSYTTKYF